MRGSSLPAHGQGVARKKNADLALLPCGQHRQGRPGPPLGRVWTSLPVTEWPINVLRNFYPQGRACSTAELRYKSLVVATTAYMTVVGFEDSPVLWVEQFEILKQFRKWKGIC